MKLLSVVALTLAVAVASKHPRYDYDWESVNRPEYGIESNQFEQGKEYQYIYNGQLMTGIPQTSEQHSATRIQAVVSIIFESKQKMQMQLRHVRFATLNQHVSEPRRIQPFELFEPIQIVEKHLETLRLPINCNYVNGMVRELVFDGAEQPWSANIKRGVLNMIQVNLRKERRTDLASIQGEEKETIQPFDFFTTQENTIEGDCETAYTVESLPNHRNVEDVEVLNVTKSINFEQCQRRPVINYNFRIADSCPSCEQRYNAAEKMLRSSSLIHQSLIVSPNREECLIETAVVESQYTFVPYTEEGNVVQTYVNMTLELIKSSSIENQPPTLQSPIKSDSEMIYTPDWDIEKEAFFMEGENSEFLQNTPYAEIPNKVEFVKQIVEKCVHYMRDSVNEEAPRQFARLVKVMRMMKRSELEKVFENFVQQSSFSKEESHKVKSIVIDALALAGTNDAVEMLVEKIEQNQIQPLRAALVLRKFTQIRTVTKQMIEKVWQLATPAKCEESTMVCQSAALACGSLLNAICKLNEDRLAIEFKPQMQINKQCTKQDHQKWAQKLITRFEESKSDYERIVFMKSIGNAGMTETLARLVEIIRSSEYSPLVRAEAVLATRQLVDVQPREVQKALLPIYLNYRQTPQQVRIVCLHQLLATQPEKSILDQLTRSLMTEQSRQVASFAFTAMQAYANSTNPCEKRMARDLTLSLRHARYLPTGQWMTYSQFLRAQYHSQRYNRGFNVDAHAIMSNYSYVPQQIRANLAFNAGSLWMRNAVGVGALTQNLEQYVRRVVREMSHDLQTPFEKLFSASNSGSSEESRISPKFAKSLEKFFEDMSIEERRSAYETDVQPLLAFYLTLANQDQAVVPITKELFSEQWLNVFSGSNEKLNMEKMIKRARKLLTDVTLPFDVHTATFVQELSRKIPTTIGLPLELTITTPTVLQARGSIKIDFDIKNPMRKFEVELREVRPSMTITKIQKVEIWSPICNSALKVVSTVHINAPFSGKVSFNGQKSQPEIKITYKPSEKAFDLVRIESRPITSVLVWPKELKHWKEPEEKTILGSEWTRENRFNNKFGENALGLEVQTRGHWHSAPTTKVSTTPFCLFAGTNKLAISVRPGFEMPKEYTMTISGKLFERLSKQNMGQKMNDFFTESDEYLKSSSEEQSSQEYANNYEGRNPTSHQLQFNLETIGSPIKRECVVEVSAKCGDNYKACTYNMKTRRSAIPHSEENKEWKMEAEISTLYPQTPETLEQLKDRKYMGRLNAKWGNQKFIDMKLVGKQSDIMEQLLENSNYRRSMKNMKSRKSLFSPVAQYEHTLKYGLLDQYKLDADYDVSPFVRNLTAKAFGFVKYMYYWDTQVNGLQLEKSNGRQQIVARLNIDPINRQYVNITVQTPSERVNINDVALPMPVGGVNIRRQSYGFKSMVNSYNEETLGVCQVRSGRVNTFDGVKYSSPIPECYTLIAKDCHHSKQSKFAVFIKEEDNEYKTLKIVTQNIKLVVRGQEGELECKLNGEIRDCSSIEEVFIHGRHQALRVSQGAYLKIELPEAGIRVYFDGLSVNVKSSKHYSSQLCGLCGQYDNEQSCDLKSAQGVCLSAQRPSDIRQFVQSYMIEECQLAEEEHHYTYQPFSWEEESQEEIYRDQEMSQYKKELKPRHITRVIEQRGQVCFSKQPVYRCPRNTRPLEHEMTETKVVYACLDRSDVRTEDLHRIANERRVVPGVEELKASFTHQLYQPSKCVRV